MKTEYLKLLSLSVLIGAAPLLTSAQREVATQNFANTTDGSPVSTLKYENITGTPYFNEDWSIGVVQLVDGRTFKDIRVKYDQVADELHFEKDGKEFLFVNPVAEFKITTISKLAEENSFYFKRGFKPDPRIFFQVIADGKTSLVKKTKKVIVDKTPYNSATIIKSFEPQVRYFVHKNNKFVPVKSNKKSILSALGDKQNELDSYINREGINFNDDDDLGKLLTYYNSL